jgi:ferredoxin
MFDSYSATTLRYNPDRCINCGRCSQVCPHGVFAGGERKAELVCPAACMECGACAGNCPVRAIEVESGVGCAWAMISAALRGKDMDSCACNCGGETGSCCSGGGEPAPNETDLNVSCSEDQGSPCCPRSEGR